MLWYLRGHSWKERNKKQKNKLYIPLIIVFFIAAVLLLLQSKQKNKTISVVCVQKGGYEFRDFKLSRAKKYLGVGVA